MNARNAGLPVVTGLGAVSSLGLGAAAHTGLERRDWCFPDPEAVLAACAADPGKHAAPRGLPESFAIGDYVRAVGLRRKQRFSRLAMAAAVDAHARAGFPERPGDPARIGIVASTEYGPQRVVQDYLRGLLDGGLSRASPGLFTQTVYNVANGQASIALGLKGANSTLVGGSALAYGAGLIRSGRADAILAMSLEETNDIVVERLRRTVPEPLLPFRVDEAAAVLVLEAEASARARGVRPLARLLGLGLGSVDSGGLEYTDWPRRPEPFLRVMRAALAEAGVEADRIDLAVSAANGIEAPTLGELEALRGLGHRGAVACPRLLAGECFGGDEALALVLALSNGPPGGLVLVTSTTGSGSLCCAVLRRTA